MTRLNLYDDARAKTFEPFVSSRPLAEMRAGALLIRDRWATVAPSSAIEIIAGPNMREFDEPDAAPVAGGTLPRGSIVANSRCVPALRRGAGTVRQSADDAHVWRCGGRVAAVRTGADIAVRDFENGSITLDELGGAGGNEDVLEGWWIDEVWDFVGFLPEILADDLTAISGGPGGAARTPTPPHVTIIGSRTITLLGSGHDAPTIEPHVVFDVTNGPIVVDRGAVVHAFTRLAGPCYIGPNVSVMGGDISVCSIGPVCKVRGEMSNTVMLGYSNKGHDGFIGHSYLGRWVNIGASTVTSNLKNTYGSVALWTPDGIRDTGMQFLGTLFGDHVKTGIGLRLTTGTVLGTGANVYAQMPPKVVAPFSWGSAPPYSLYRVDKFIETAERMMSRRHVALSDRARRHLTAVHFNRWSEGEHSPEI